ncbi:MAG TPA: formylglycine-generating enzyme family protein [Advenella sp.]|nr:formylglycine-generating enzyme family protein [Advenella sp.]
MSSDEEPRKACCVPAAPLACGGSPRPGNTQVRAAAPESAGGSGLILIPAQQFLMGSNDLDGFRDDGEGPPRLVTVDAFRIAPTVVTNRQFADFVRDTRYITDAERAGASFVFYGQLSGGGDTSSLPAPPGLPWWRLVAGAAWQRPEGPGSHIHDRPDYPVVHVSWFDAQAYCAWSGLRLPTEAQWECAARGGLQGKRYPWGDELMPGGQMRCNIWQGTFPDNPAAGWTLGPLPARSFEPNGYGLYNTAGNVWEWCADSFSPQYHQVTGSYNPIFSEDSGYRSMRGGSFLCDASYCNRYRVGARNSNTPDSTTSNCGFRVVK